jgi:hypothetical protein
MPRDSVTYEELGLKLAPMGGTPRAAGVEARQDEFYPYPLSIFFTQVTLFFPVQPIELFKSSASGKRNRYCIRPQNKFAAKRGRKARVLEE